MKENQVGAILAKYGVQRTGTGGAKALPAPVSMPAGKGAGQKNAILAKYGVAPGREGEILAQAQAAARETPVPAVEEAAPRAVLLPTLRRDSYQPKAVEMEEGGTQAAQPSVLLRDSYQPKVAELPEPGWKRGGLTSMGRQFQALPSVEGLSEREELRQESRLRTQLAKGTSPEELGERAQLRELRLQNISAQELKKRQEQAVGHLKEAQRAIAERETAPYAAGTAPAAGGLPYAAGAGAQPEEEKALRGELDKWQGIVNDLSARYYYRENEETAAKLAGDRAGLGRVQVVEDILADLRTLGEIAAGQYGDRRAAEELGEKYGLSQRELEVQAPALVQQLQEELEKAKEEAKAAGYDYDRMTGYQERKEQTRRAIEGQRRTEEFARKHPVIASAASILASPVQGVDYLAQTAKGYGHSDPEKLESYVPANVYEMRCTNFVRNVRGTVAKGLEEKYGLSVGKQNVASFLYQTGMSMGDFLFNAMITGNFSGGLGGTGSQAAQKAASDLSLAIMGSGAAANTTAEAIERGLSNRQAYTLGAIAGVAEIVTEKVSLETLLDRTALDRSARGYLLKNILAEGSEEVASDLINWAGDVLVAKDRSQWAQAIREYQAQGMGEKEALQMALKDQLIDMAWSGLGGGLSGGVMAGGRIAINSAMEGYQNRGAKAGPEVMQAEKTAPVEEAEYRAMKPQNVEIPTVPLIDLSTKDIPGVKGVLPKTGEALRKDAVLRARKRLGLDQGAAAYIPVSNVVRDGNEYVLKITKPTLNKMLYPAAGAALPVESIVVMDNLERIANNGVYFKSEADRDARAQIPGWDHLMTTVYIDGVPYSVDMRVKLVEERPGSGPDNVLYYYSPEEIVKIEKVGSKAPTVERRALNMNSELEPTSDPIIPTFGDGVNKEYAKGGAEYTGKPEVKRLPVAEKPGPKLLPKAEAGGGLSGGVMAGGRIAIDSAMDSYLNRSTDGGPEVMQAEKTASSAFPKMRLEDFTDVQSPVWNNVAYEDAETQRQIMGDTHQRMVESGEIVRISQETMEQVGKYYPDLRTMKKTERTPILKQKMGELKAVIRGILNGLKGSHEFEVNGNILDVKLYDAGVNEVMEKVTQSKAEMLTHSGEIFQKAQYMYSTPDYDGDVNIYRWNYFYAPVQMGDGEIVGVRIAVRDMKQTQYGQAESQLYHWGIKKAPALDGESPDIKSLSFGASSAGADGFTLDGGGDGNSRKPFGVSSVETSDIILPQDGKDVKGQYAQEGETYTGKPEVKRLPVAKKPGPKMLPKAEAGGGLSGGVMAGGRIAIDSAMDSYLNRSTDGGPEVMQAEKTASLGETVKADTSLFDRRILKDLNQARKRFLDFARRSFPTVVVNNETGKTIKISRNGLDKFLSGRLPYEKYATGFHIPELMEQAHKVGEAADAKGRIDILGYEYYDSPITVDGTEYMAHIRVRNTNSGDSYYGHTISEIEDIKIEPSARVATTGASKPVYAIDDSTSDPIIPVSGDGVNREYAKGGAEYTAAQPGRENPFLQTEQAGEFVDDRTAAEKAMVEEARRRKEGRGAGEEPTYRMTPAMEKLGMEAPVRPITDAGMAESLRANEKALYEAKRALDKALKDTHADKRAQSVAKGIVEGIYTFADADKMGLDRRAMTDIVEAMELVKSYNAKNIKAHQERTNWVFDGKVQELIKDAGSWKPPSLVSMNASTMQRNVERMMDPATARAINEEFFEPVLKNEASRLRFANRQLDRIRGYQLNTQESAMVQRLMEGKITVTELRGLGYNVSRIEAAAKTFSEMYAAFYDPINDFLVSHGYEEIGWQRNYAPHIQKENLTKLQKYLQRLGFSAEVAELPTEIAGRTDAYKPGKQYDPFFQHRTGGGGDIKYDAVGGMESYINYLSNVLYHTDDIQKLRRLSEGIREKFAEGYLREELDQLNDLQNRIAAGEDVRESWEAVQARKDKLYEELDKKTKLGGFVSVLDDYTNILAGKQSKFDRAFEAKFGRPWLNFGRNIQNAFARAAVVGNLSSAINQTVQLPQLTAEVGPKYVIQAVNDVASGRLGEFSKESTFLTGKRGIQTVSALEGMEWLYGKLSMPFEIVDDLASRIIVRAKYLQQVGQGMDHAGAMKAADQYANRLVGSRMKGAKPIVFEQKNPVTKLVTTFQLEVANGWEHIFHDLPMEIQETARTQGKAAAVGKTVKLAVAAEAAAFLANLLIKGITGREPVPFDGIGMFMNYMASGYGMTKENFMKAVRDREELPEEFDVGAALGEAAGGVMDNVPFANNITTLLGVTDGRLLLPQIETKKLGGAVKDAWTAVTSKDEEEREKAKARVLPQAVGGVAGTVASFIPAGNQLKKTFKALPVLRRGGAYTGSGEEERLKYPVEQSAANWAKGLMFGTSALPETDAYYAEGNRTLTAKETKVYEELVKAGSDGQKVYDTMQELKGTKERTGKVDVLLAYDGTRAEKEALFSGMVTETLNEELEGLAGSGVSFDTVLEAYKAQYGLEGDKDPKTGETVPLSLARKKKAAVDRVLSELTQRQREAVYGALGISEKVWGK